MSEYTFIEPNAAFPLPATFNFDEYIETERELWALFPETDGRRVNFVQIGLTAMIYAEVPDTGAELAFDETYILMPCEDFAMRPIRMRACRRLDLERVSDGSSHRDQACRQGQRSRRSDARDRLPDSRRGSSERSAGAADRERAGVASAASPRNAILRAQVGRLLAPEALYMYLIFDL